MSLRARCFFFRFLAAERKRQQRRKNNRRIGDTRVAMDFSRAGPIPPGYVLYTYLFAAEETGIFVKFFFFFPLLFSFLDNWICRRRRGHKQINYTFNSALRFDVFRSARIRCVPKIYLIYTLYIWNESKNPHRHSRPKRYSRKIWLIDNLTVFRIHIRRILYYCTAAEIFSNGRKHVEQRTRYNVIRKKKKNLCLRIHRKSNTIILTFIV